MAEMTRTENLVKVSTYARMTGKSVESIRVWIRTGKFKENREYVVIDGIKFIDLEKVK